ncbi:hypothetical protein HHK36_015001 [Tetracentron sinense]|uniref:Uncharacterized protein n=1 Tax=Tetracentron sinense TaxID=13715 RepID=A0A835DDF9_TETSI|nr:hypothetical protein HHK36_015001 [Tetracentron sinense]
MALCIAGGCVVSSSSRLWRQRVVPSNTYASSSSFRRRTAFVVGARKVSPRTGKFDSKNKRSGSGLNTTTTTTTTTKEEEEEEIERGPDDSKNSTVDADVDVDDGYFLPDLPGDQPDFWEGPQWNGLGFFIQYQWAFGIAFAVFFFTILFFPPLHPMLVLTVQDRRYNGYEVNVVHFFQLIACGIAVATYNEGATDFKKTPVYKESIQSRELLEEPEASNSDVFEGNPTEEAPSLE